MKKNRKVKLIKIIVISLLITTTVTAATLISSKDVQYTTESNADITNVSDALDDLIDEVDTINKTGTATADDILKGKTAYVQGKEVVGELSIDSHTKTFSNEYRYYDDILFYKQYNPKTGAEVIREVSNTDGGVVCGYVIAGRGGTNAGTWVERSLPLSLKVDKDKFYQSSMLEIEFHFHRGEYANATDEENGISSPTYIDTMVEGLAGSYFQKHLYTGTVENYTTEFTRLRKYLVIKIYKPRNSYEIYNMESNFDYNILAERYSYASPTLVVKNYDYGIITTGSYSDFSSREGIIDILISPINNNNKVTIRNVTRMKNVTEKDWEAISNFENTHPGYVEGYWSADGKYAFLIKGEQKKISSPLWKDNPTDKELEKYWNDIEKAEEAGFSYAYTSLDEKTEYYTKPEGTEDVLNVQTDNHLFLKYNKYTYITSYKK